MLRSGRRLRFADKADEQNHDKNHINNYPARMVIVEPDVQRNHDHHDYRERARRLRGSTMKHHVLSGNPPVPEYVGTKE